METYPSIFRFASSCLFTSIMVYPDIEALAIKKNVWEGNKTSFLLSWDLADGEYPSWLEFPVVFRQCPHSDGKKLRDIMDTGSGDCYLISQRLKEILTANDVTGWKRYPAIVFDKDGNEIPGYYGFSITGRGGDFTRKGDGLYAKNTLYDIRQWDGSDLFFIGGEAWMTERVFRLLKTERVSALESWPSKMTMTIIDHD